MVSATGGMLSSAASGAGGWLKNTYNRLMAKQDGSGRALIRETGAGILSIIAMASIISPLLDRIGIGKIPFVGTLVKLAALVAVFMVARKGIDTFMSPVTPMAASTGAVMTTGSAPTGVHLPTLTKEQLTGQTIQFQNPADGSTARTAVVGQAANADNIDPAVQQAAASVPASAPVAQMTDKTTTFVAMDAAANDDIFQSVRTRGNVIHVARDCFNRKSTEIPAVETVPHDQAGAELTRRKISGTAVRPAVDGNAALNLEMP